MGDLNDSMRFGLINRYMEGDLNTINPFTGMSLWDEEERKYLADYSKTKNSYLWDKFYEQSDFAKSAIKKKVVKAALIKTPHSWDSNKPYSDRSHVYVDKDKLPWHGYVCYSGPLKNLDHRVLRLVEDRVEIINNKNSVKVIDVNTGETFKLPCNDLTYPGMLEMM